MNKSTFAKSLFLLILFLWLKHTDALSQLPDGTIADMNYINEIVKNIDDEKQVFIDSTSADNNYSYFINTYVVSNANGKYIYSDEALHDAIDRANELFKPIHVSFIRGEINYVPEYLYSYIIEKEGTTELLVKYKEAGKINLYLVDSIVIDDAERYGFTYFPTDSLKNYIFLERNYLGGNFLATQLGHFMGLLSTHEIIGGIEFVNGNNCDSAGDYICDTYADPDILGQVSLECTYTGFQADPNGEDYIPSVANVMSNSRDACKCIFSHDQYRRMLYYIKKYRQRLR